MQQLHSSSNCSSYVVLVIMGSVLLGGYLYLLQGVLSLSQPPPQALATPTISAMYKRQVNLSSRCDTKVDVEGKAEECVLSRLINYCNIEEPTGGEGIRSSIPLGEWRLEHLVLNVRHGDRSAIHRIDNTYVPLPYEGSGDVQSLKILQRLRVASKFRVLPVPQSVDFESSHAALTSEGYSVYNYNPIDSFMDESDRDLISGQLTTVGFYQLITLGDHLSGSYMPLLGRVQERQSNPRILIRSTSYNRTIQSVAGFLSSFLPSNVHYADVKIYYQPHTSMENMHGFISNKMHISSKPTTGGIISRDGVTHTSTSHSMICPKAVAALKRMSSSYQETAPETFQRLVNVYSPAVMERYTSVEHITEVADPLLTSFCHQEKYPCGAETNKCGSDSLLRAVMVDADRSFCERFTSINGGQEYTRLDIYPFMSEIKIALVNAAKEIFMRTTDGKAKGKDPNLKRDNSPLIHIFSGHDTVIAPVLTALGVYQHSAFCSWPDYASRIAFEAWFPIGKKLKENPLGNGINSTFALRNSNVHIRVVYNGHDVTGHIPACAPHNLQYGKENGIQSYLCPIELFVDQIDSILGSSSDLEEACRL